MSSPKLFNKFRSIKKTRLWAFTVKIHADGKTADEKSYEPFFKILYQLSEVITMCGEIDSKNILHYHGVIRLSSNFYRKNLRVKGYHLYLKRIFAIRQWVNYCFKYNFEYSFKNMKNCLI